MNIHQMVTIHMDSKKDSKWWNLKTLNNRIQFEKFLKQCILMLIPKMDNFKFVVESCYYKRWTYSLPQPSGPAKMKGCRFSSVSNHLSNKSRFRFTSGVKITGSLVVEKSSVFKLSGTLTRLFKLNYWFVWLVWM